MKASRLMILALLLTAHAFGQTIAGAGYADPTMLRVAPGQVIPLFVTGVAPQGPVRAGGYPLPTTLAGFSVTLTQTLPPASRSLPIFSVEQIGGLTAITVQIPYDLPVPNPLIMAAVAQGSANLTISENGVPGKAFSIYVVADQVHVLKSCDVNGTTRGTGVCFPLVTHNNGSLVLEDVRASGQTMTDSEAKPGEVLTMYAYGLGGVSAAVEAGSPSPLPPAETTIAFSMRYDFLPNASPSLPTAQAGSAAPLFAGLTPGLVGLYQINFRVPQPPAGIPNCGAPIESNLTVSVGPATQGSFDGAAICVDVSTP